MYTAISAFMFSIILSLIILLTSLVLSMRSVLDREKASPFECGFDPNSSARLPFSLRFFLLGVIFLVFDIEIILLMPLPISFSANMGLESVMAGGLFIIILIVGLLHEWNEGSLEWAS